MVIDIILNYIEVNKIAKSGFEKKIKVANAYLSKMRGGGKIGDDILERIYSNYPELEQPIKNEIQNEAKEKYDKVLKSMQRESEEQQPEKLLAQKVVPVYGDGGAIASPQLVTADPHYPTEWRAISASMFEDCEAILPVFGNSMTPSYPPGAELAIARDNKSFFEWGEVYVLEIEGSDRPMFKRVYESEKEGHITLYSDNQMKQENGQREGKYVYPPITVPLDQIRAKWCVLGDQKRRQNKSIALRNMRENLVK